MTLKEIFLDNFIYCYKPKSHVYGRTMRRKEFWVVWFMCKVCHLIIGAGTLFSRLPKYQAYWRRLEDAGYPGWVGMIPVVRFFMAMLPTAE